MTHIPKIRLQRYIFFRGFANFVLHFSTAISAKVTEKNTKSLDAVTLCTMHGSKGLEYKKVYIPFCVEGVTPHKKAVGEEALEEERRLFYVAMTRAKEELVISAHKKGGENRRELSRFVGEAGLIRCETGKDVL